nr:MAG TPA: hypothetical protein [Caudoviricetes sp.]
MIPSPLFLPIKRTAPPVLWERLRQFPGDKVLYVYTV